LRLECAAPLSRGITLSTDGGLGASSQNRCSARHTRVSTTSQGRRGRPAWRPDDATANTFCAHDGIPFPSTLDGHLLLADTLGERARRIAPGKYTTAVRIRFTHGNLLLANDFSLWS